MNVELTIEEIAALRALIDWVRGWEVYEGSNALEDADKALAEAEENPYDTDCNLGHDAAGQYHTHECILAEES